MSLLKYLRSLFGRKRGTYRRVEWVVDKNGKVVGVKSVKDSTHYYATTVAPQWRE